MLWWAPKRDWQSQSLFKIIVIRCLKCSHCNRIHHDFPDFGVPYKRYVGEAIESVVANTMQAAALRPLAGCGIHKIDDPLITIW